MTQSSPLWMNSAPAGLLGLTEPRLWTPPLRPLTPETSYGFDVIDFARDIYGVALDPWQEWAAIHLGELLPDGRPRFRTVLILVARQNGKTLLARVLVAYWMFVERIPLILNTSTDRRYAKRFWTDTHEFARTNPHFAAELGPTPVRLTPGEESMRTAYGSELIFAANNGRAGRSTTLHRWLCDELREHHSRDCWDSASNAMNAVPGAQIVCITNQGDEESVVLDSLRESALEYINTGKGDPRLGLIEYSAPDGADPADPEALRMANPNLGRRLDVDAVMGTVLRAKRAGGAELAGARTEILCQRVHQLDPAIDPELWDMCGIQHPIDLAGHRDKTALCLDISLDGSHATLAAAAVVDGIVHVEIIDAWEGFGCTKALREELPGWVDKIKPRALGWFPAGPAAAVAADIADRNVRGWPPRRVAIEAIGSETVQVCMGFAEQVITKGLKHPQDPMLTAHINAASKLYRGDGYVFNRKGKLPIDGAYAVAGAVHLARTLPPAPPALVAL